MNRPAKRTTRKVFGKYTLMGKLASGGMGEIYLARLQGVAGFEKIVVIKRILPHLAENDRYRHMLLDEARIAAQLNHPNVCQVHELDEADGEYYIAMEYLEGFTMAEILRRMAKLKQRLDPRLVIGTITQACEGLHAAHELVDRTGTPTNLVHRDVSPSNVFITAAGSVKILDFGVAKTPDKLANTRTGAVKGKWAYMSPEQIMRKPLDRRSDIFSLGVVTYEALTGKRLFRRRSEYEICQAITESDAPSVREGRPELPDELAGAVAKALNRSRRHRYFTASEMSKVLTRSVASLGGPAGLSEIADFISDHFVDELEVRRDFVRQVDAPMAIDPMQDVSGPLPIAPTVHTDTSVNSGAVEIDFDNPTPMTTDSQPFLGRHRVASRDLPPGVFDSSKLQVGKFDITSGRVELEEPPSLAVKKSRWKMWVLVLALVAAGGGGTYAYVLTRPPSSGLAADVDLQRGAIVHEDPVTTRDPDRVANDVPPNPGDDPGDDPAGDPGARAGVAPDAGATGDTPDGSDEQRVRDRRRNRPVIERASLDDPRSYSRLVRQRGAKITQCFHTYAADIDPWPQMLIGITLDKSGRVTDARVVKPAEHRGTPLGTCVTQLIRTIEFGKGSGPAKVEVPLGGARTRTIRRRKAD